jgi:hypothetical protein
VIRALQRSPENAMSMVEAKAPGRARPHPGDQAGTHGAQRTRQRRRGFLALPLVALFGGIVLGIAAVAWLLWPRWPAPNVPVDAPSLPITVQGVTFNIPPGAIRVKAQRKPGAQERVDLAFMWPGLTPPEERPAPAASPKGIDRIFLTIAASDGSLPPLERFKTIYPRYLDDSIRAAEGGLTARPFREGTPYQGEEILYDQVNPERFAIRCTHDGPRAMVGMCLYQRRIAQADITVRFPREWLSEWTGVLGGIERLLAGFRISGR